MLISASINEYLNSLLLNMTVMVSAMPDAIDPFLLVFNANALSSGGRILMRWGMGALLMTLTMAVYDLSS